MARELRFEVALEIWKKWRAAECEDAVQGKDHILAEEIILECVPTSPSQAEVIVEVVAFNVDAGPRSDGRDIMALKNVAAFIRDIGVRGFPAPA